jgi:peptidoglycan/xylan/chitin deacetylase (PgdA/CDA1 family)
MRFSAGILASHFLARTRLGRLLGRAQGSEVCIFTFHGLRETEQDSSGLLDTEPHLPVGRFRQFCTDLKASYKVVSVADWLSSVSGGPPLPERAVMLTFDDGYASNYELALPVLRELELPATAFLTTGFVDGTLGPWFVRLERALAMTPRSDVKWGDVWWSLSDLETRRAVYLECCGRWKQISYAEMLKELSQLESALEVGAYSVDDLPRPLRPMTWEMAREMQASGWIEFGGHTHTHPVLARLSEAEQAQEITTCATRMNAELGRSPRVFAYPNGKEGDYNEHTRKHLKAAGFQAAFTMAERLARRTDASLSVPRYGCPENSIMLEAIASGGCERLARCKAIIKRGRAD